MTDTLHARVWCKVIEDSSNFFKSEVCFGVFCFVLAFFEHVFLLMNIYGNLVLQHASCIRDKESLQPKCRSLTWGKACLVARKAVYGFILLIVVRPSFLLWECHTICSGAVCSLCYQLRCAFETSLLKYNQPVSLFYQECFGCLVEFWNFSFLKAIFLASFDSTDCFPWAGGNFLGIALLSADVSFLKKKSRFLDVFLLLYIVYMILTALTMFYQWQLEVRHSISSSWRI